MIKELIFLLSLLLICIGLHFGNKLIKENKPDAIKAFLFLIFLLSGGFLLAYILSI